MRTMLISSTLAEETTPPVLIYHRHGYITDNVPVTLWCWGLGAGETIEIQFETDLASPDNWVSVYELTASINTTTIYAPIKFRVIKPLTAALVGVAMSNVEGI